MTQISTASPVLVEIEKLVFETEFQAIVVVKDLRERVVDIMGAKNFKELTEAQQRNVTFFFKLINTIEQLKESKQKETIYYRDNYYKQLAFIHNRLDPISRIKQEMTSQEKALNEMKP